MRVISGEHRGRTLKAPKGDATRPTTDRVKESVMSSLVSALGSFDGVVVLDAFAGSGSLGIEALSRGAAKAVFCEKARPAQLVISENLKTLHYDSSQAALVKTDVMAFPSSVCANTYDLVFLDPPYAINPETVFAFIQGLFEKSCLKENSLICYELTKTNKQSVEALLNTLEWVTISNKVYGDTSVVIFRKGA